MTSANATKFDFGNLMVSEMSKLLKVASKEECEDHCIKLWCCHPSHPDATVIDLKNFETMQEAREALFSPEHSFDQDKLDKTMFVELCCEGESTLREFSKEEKSEEVSEEDEKESNDENHIEIVLVEADELTEAGEALLGMASKLVSSVVKIANELEAIKSPLTADADDTLTVLNSVLTDVQE